MANRLSLDEIFGKSPAKQRPSLSEIFGESDSGMGEKFNALAKNPDIQNAAKFIKEKPFMRRGASLMSGKSLEEVDRVLEKIPEPKPSIGGAVLHAAPDIAMATPVMKVAGAIPKLPSIIKAGIGIGAYEGAKAQGQGREVVPAVIGGVATGAAFAGAGRIATTLLPKTLPAREIVGGVSGGAVVGAAASPDEEKLQGAVFGGGLGAFSPAKAFKKPSNPKFAARVVNSLIKPSKQELRFSNPGEGIAKEGIVADNIEDLAKKVSARRELLNSNIDALYSQNRDKLADYRQIFKPILDVRKRLAEHPASNSAAISRIDNALSDITGASKNKVRSFNNLTPEEARSLKQEVSRFVDWGLSGKSDREINIAFKMAYKRADNILDSRVPEGKLLNKRISSMISAESALENTIRKNMSKEVVPSIFSVGNLPLRPFKSTSIKTRTASALIGEKYPELNTNPEFVEARSMPKMPIGLPLKPSEQTGYRSVPESNKEKYTAPAKEPDIIYGKEPPQEVESRALIPIDQPRTKLSFEEMKKQMKQKSSGQILRSEKRTVVPESIIEKQKRILGNERGSVFIGGRGDVTTKVLKVLDGRETVPKQFISDLTNKPELKQAERDLIRSTLERHGDKVDVKKFTEEVKAQLIPLKLNDQVIKGRSWEHINLPDEQRGPVENYTEHVYESPIRTSAGDVHFNKRNYPNYFAHTRVEDLPKEGLSAKNAQSFKDSTGTRRTVNASGKSTTRRILEIQSDLFQKGNLDRENEFVLAGELRKNSPNKAKYTAMQDKRAKDLEGLRPFENTWHERVIREEIAQAAKDGKTKLQFPTGETAMKIEGIAGNDWIEGSGAIVRDPYNIRVGQILKNKSNDHEVIFLGAGPGDEGHDYFYAIDKDAFDSSMSDYINAGFSEKKAFNKALEYGSENAEQIYFSSISNSNPIYRFYDKEIAKYLKRIAPDMRQITDKQGVTWNEIDVPREAKSNPIEAFGVLGPQVAIGSAIGTAAAIGNARKATADNKSDTDTILDYIYKAESSSGKDKKAKKVNKSGALGDYQLTRSVYASLKRDFPNKWGKKHFLDVAGNSKLSREAARDAISVSIPKDLASNGVASTRDAILQAYISGARNVRSGNIGKQGMNYYSNFRKYVGKSSYENSKSQRR